MDAQSIYNYARNKNKLITNLISIIEGILSDGRVDEKEILYLDTWLLESELISRNYCVRTIRARISDILSNRVIDNNELKFFQSDLIKIQKKLLDTPKLDLYSEESDRHLLEGLCKGVLANQELNDLEIRYLKWWLSSNAALKNNFPGKEIYILVENILADGVITPEERASLKAALTSFTGCDLEVGVVDGLSTKLPIDDIDSLNLKGALVCLTGEFLLGKRSKCKTEIESMGGIVSDGITQKIDYLIVGTLSAKDWRFQSYGRKIEKAIEYRDNKNIPLKIISEEQWKTLSCDTIY
ncbi:NAD-dependent DNA ligase [Chania multitudinisentens RB-25]|uniref:NAD-dependent DNA ligase n=1 Tax=Chania multitudinisentens RB-25 TaxID=1441930 RepID=W0L901_9GAMM|nr:BRCT domain-containing protein [Chania multitudinisentens]AHG18450.1 NAD-dependent DNA ligase [Chania multitudinisentens RB-25]